MASILDVMFSIVLGGTLLMITLDANQIASEDAALHHGDQMVQETAVALSLYLDGELRNMGFGVPDTIIPVIQADTTSITYYVDNPPFGSIDIMRFYLGPTSELASTPNSQDRYIYQQINGGTPFAIAVVTNLKFAYLDQNDAYIKAPVSKWSLGKVMKVESTTEVQNPYALFREKNSVHAGERDALYSSFLWHQTRLASQNVRVAAKPAQKIRRKLPPPPSNPPKKGPSSSPPKSSPSKTGISSKPTAKSAVSPPKTGTTGKAPSKPPSPPAPKPAPPPKPPPPPPKLGLN